jgi:hypothetical protein
MGAQIDTEGKKTTFPGYDTIILCMLRMEDFRALKK